MLKYQCRKVVILMSRYVLLNGSFDSVEEFCNSTGLPKEIGDFLVNSSIIQLDMGVSEPHEPESQKTETQNNSAGGKNSIFKFDKDTILSNLDKLSTEDKDLLNECYLALNEDTCSLQEYTLKFYKLLLDLSLPIVVDDYTWLINGCYRYGVDISSAEGLLTLLENSGYDGEGMCYAFRLLMNLRYTYNFDLDMLIDMFLKLDSDNFNFSSFEEKVTFITNLYNVVGSVDGVYNTFSKY